jgi:four helix bundle protein
MPFLFEKLEVYKKALGFCNEITKDTEYQKGFYSLLDQLRRASMSISLNIAEGNGRFSKNDRKQFFLIARGSAFECIPLLEMCRSNKILTNDKVEKYRKDLDEVCRMITGLIAGIENRE